MQGWKSSDFANAAEFEGQVKNVLPPWHIDESKSTTRLDFWVPGLYVEVKEKRQKLTDRWHLIEGVAERDIFVLDELSLRKALEHYPAAYFVIRDVPGGDRVFLAGVWEVACVPRVRRDRGGKGKLLINLSEFRQLDSLDQIVPIAMADLAATAWRQSNCVSEQEVGQI